MSQFSDVSFKNIPNYENIALMSMADMGDYGGLDPSAIVIAIVIVVILCCCCGCGMSIEVAILAYIRKYKGDSSIYQSIFGPGPAP
jgi:hypothetical protein